MRHVTPCRLGAVPSLCAGVNDHLKGTCTLALTTFREVCNILFGPYLHHNHSDTDSDSLPPFAVGYDGLIRQHKAFPAETLCQSVFVCERLMRMDEAQSLLVNGPFGSNSQLEAQVADLGTPRPGWAEVI